VRAVEALHAAFRFPETVGLVDGGTLGLNLLGYVVSSQRMLVLDAIDFGLAPGTLRVLRDGEVPAWTKTRLSAHQNGFNDVLALAQLHDRAPDSIVLVGVQPAQLGDFGGSLTEQVKARLPDAVTVAERELALWGFPGAPRASHEVVEPLNAASLNLNAYEGERPSADSASRIGDGRLLRTAKPRV
jgi:hydrogenase maturation protease